MIYADLAITAAQRLAIFAHAQRIELGDRTAGHAYMATIGTINVGRCCASEEQEWLMESD
jgi:hypothetical protein